MRYFSAAVLLLLTACSSQPVTTFYQLPVAPVTAKHTVASPKPLYVEPVQVASYLNGRGLVLQLSDVELVMARQHLWAEPLEQQLQRQVRDRLLPLAQQYTAVMQAAPETLRIAVQIDQFHGLADGYAIISGRFAVSGQASAQSFNIRVALADDGYPALVAALAEGIQLLSSQIAQQINS
jgi:uncharacterized protein